MAEDTEGATAAAEEKTGTKTSYVVLRRVDPTTPGEEHPLANKDLWMEVGRIDGHGPEPAARSYLNDPRLEEGDYEIRVVPVRNWPAKPHATATIKQARTVTFGG